MAVRTANFISAFLQVVDPKEIFPGLIYRFNVLMIRKAMGLKV